jgi:hypothetical protein
MSSETPITDKQIASAQAKMDARKRFESVFPLLVDEATTYLRSIHLPENAIEWYKQVRFNKLFVKLTVEFELQYPWRKTQSRHVGG